MSEETTGQLDRTHCIEGHPPETTFKKTVEQAQGEAEREIEQMAEEEAKGYEDEDRSMSEEVDVEQPDATSELTPKPTDDRKPTAVSGVQAKPSAAAIPLDGLDESVKQLVMAWYWAGYYQGLQVGRTEASAANHTR